MKTSSRVSVTQKFGVKSFVSKNTCFLNTRCSDLSSKHNNVNFSDVGMSIVLKVKHRQTRRKQSADSKFNLSATRGYIVAENLYDLTQECTSTSHKAWFTRTTTAS